MILLFTVELVAAAVEATLLVAAVEEGEVAELFGSQLGTSTVLAPYLPMVGPVEMELLVSAVEAEAVEAELWSYS
jgi:hypothetical protein